MTSLNMLRVRELLDFARKNDTFVLTTREFAEFENDILDALRHSIPEKPIKTWEYNFDPAIFGLCPSCNEEVNSQKEYCNYCGQHLDWSDCYDKA